MRPRSSLRWRSPGFALTLQVLPGSMAAFNVKA